MPPPSLLFDEAASLDALRQFVMTAIPEVPGVDVYRARPPASPGKWGLSVVLRPLTPLPVLGSPMGEESTGTQRQRVRVAVTKAAAGAWTLRVLGQDAIYMAPVDASPAGVVAGLQVAIDALDLPLTTTALVPPAMGFEASADDPGVSMTTALTAIPAEGDATVTMVDDCLRRCVYNWGTWTVRAVVRDIPSAAGTAPSMVGPYVERLRLMMQGTSIPVTPGLAYPYMRDRMAAARMHWRQTLAPVDADEVQGGVWVRGCAVDFRFDVPCGLLHDVPSLDVMGQTGSATLT